MSVKNKRMVWTGQVPKVDFMHHRINHEFYYGKTASGLLEVMSPCNYSANEKTCAKYRLESDGKYYRVPDSATLPETIEIQDSITLLGWVYKLDADGVYRKDSINKES